VSRVAPLPLGVTWRQRANHRRLRTGRTNRISPVRGLLPVAAVSCNGGSVPSQQHGDGFLHELAELGEPLGADRAVHHPVVAAQRHRHHAGDIEPATSGNVASD